MSAGLPYERIARELVRRLRDGRPQREISLRLGYRSNVLHTWEVGRRYPRASEAMRLAACCGVDLAQALGRFYGPARAASLRDLDLTSPAGNAAFLSELRAGAPIAALARRCGRSRSRVSRWLGGETEPRLPDLLRVIDMASMRLLDWLAAFVDPAGLPSVRAAWKSLEAQRNLAYAAPYSEAIARALELEAYLRADRPPGWIARRLALPEEIERATLAALVRAGTVTAHVGKHRLAEVTSVDTSADRAAVWQLKRHWAQVGLDRLGPDGGGLFSYNVVAVSRADFERLTQLHLEYFDRMRTIVAESHPIERVAVANLQIFALDARADDPGPRRGKHCDR